MLNLCSLYVSMSKSFISSKNVNRQTLSFYTFILPAATFSHASLCDIGHIKRKMYGKYAVQGKQVYVLFL